jgi:hypothetical protein
MLPAESCARGRRFSLFPFPKGERSAEKRTVAVAKRDQPRLARRGRTVRGALASRRSTVAISVLGPALPVPAFEQRRPFSDINLAAKWLPGGRFPEASRVSGCEPQPRAPLPAPLQDRL